MKKSTLTCLKCGAWGERKAAQRKKLVKFGETAKGPAETFKEFAGL